MRTPEHDTCGYAVVDADGQEEPCGRPVTGWRWYQDVGEHEDMLDTACEFHENEGGNRLHAAEAELRARELHHFETEQENATLRAEVDAADSALRQVRELHVKVDHAWEDKHWCEADGREWPCQTIAILDSARVGAADTQPEGAGDAAHQFVMSASRSSAIVNWTCPCGEEGVGLGEANSEADYRRHLPTPTAGRNGDTAPEAAQTLTIEPPTV